jgi:Major Facilitator Superfamily
LFAIWSVTSFLLEVPSGAWADVVDRRLLLVLSAPIYAAGFVTWTVWPTYAGFAIGFALWGLSGALMSGTFEALLYDQLSALDATEAYAGLVGWANTAAIAATLAATAVAAPLHAWGGYAAVGWVSVGVALVHGLLAWLLPPAPKTEEADETKRFDGGATFFGRYLQMLRGGVQEATRRAPVRHLLIIAAALYGLTAYDEYFPLVAGEAGASTNEAALLVALTVGGQLAGSACAGRMTALSRRGMTAIVASSGLLIAAGALAGHPLGFVAIAAGYGLMESATIVTEAKLQDVIAGPARATVTSLSGLASEVGALAIYATVATGASWFAVSTLLAIVTLPALGVAAAIRSWWPSAALDRRRSGARSAQPVELPSRR